MSGNKATLYWLEGENNSDIFDLLEDKGIFFKTEYLEKTKRRTLLAGFALVVSINFAEKEMRVVPLEIYQKGSPTADKEKFDRITSMCKNVDELRFELSLN